MEEALKKIKDTIEAEGTTNVSKVRELFTYFMKNHLKGMHIDNYIGDYPTFMEPVYLGDSVKIGDDVLIGPNVYIGDNCEIGDYVELSNTIIFKNAKLENNVQLDNCIVGMDCCIPKNTREKDKVLYGNIKYISPGEYFSF